MSMPRTLAVAALGAVSLLALAGCSAPADAETPENAAEDYYPITVTDLAGNEVTIESADSVAVTDNRFFQLAADWDLPVSVAPRDLMSPENPLAADEEILNIGTHGEPDFEQIVAADPDLIINGYRFSAKENAQGVKDAAPDAAFVDMTGPEDQSVDEYVTESITLMGEVFNREAEAEALIEEFHTAVDGAKNAYDPESTVMGLITSGGEINYANPIDGRGSSIFFDLLGLTPALDAEGSENHTGDSVSLEALAGANADFFTVLDRDAAVGEGEVTPALDLINSSAALANVPAVKNEAIYVFPADYYLTEDVFAYTTVLNGLADLFGEN
ncbi:ABC transporter substrate-binding protein [Microbacterium sp. Bi121]|uniref:ABC transporter substrate-binding protein n=1 Tax=Microbacterium sp. Bi121 TaxID=2822348 RepID=UPI001D949A06|nr:ABC transporter substrate-binding protein [Microbacterium sp. Bi121]CAH0122960.1 putative ABC transporter solute-binding protein YclQ [Microbacterium sp. Bi121]